MSYSYDELLKAGQVGSPFGLPVIENASVPEGMAYIVQGPITGQPMVVSGTLKFTPTPWWRTDRFKVLLIRTLFALALIAGIAAAAVL